MDEMKKSAAEAQRRATCGVRTFSPPLWWRACAIGDIEPHYRDIGHAVANLKAPHPVAELINFANDIIAEHERRPAKHRLWVEVAPNQDIGVLHARGEHADPHLPSAGCRQGSVDDRQLVSAAEAPDLDNPIARLAHARIPTGRKTSLQAGSVIDQDQSVKLGFADANFRGRR
jgi:hypothetical protein